MLRYYARKFPNLFEPAMKMVAASDVWRRRAALERQRKRQFTWFVRHFGLKDSIGGEVL
jgi:hypothetical protein